MSVAIDRSYWSHWGVQLNCNELDLKACISHSAIRIQMTAILPLLGVWHLLQRTALVPDGHRIKDPVYPRTPWYATLDSSYSRVKRRKAILGNIFMANSTGSPDKSHSRLLSRKMHSLSLNKTWSDRKRRIAGILISGTFLIFEAGMLASMNEDQIDASDGFFGWSTFECFCRVWGNPGALLLWWSANTHGHEFHVIISLSYRYLPRYFPSIDPWIEGR